MSNYPNYRLAVEVILLHQDRVLLTKRASHATLGPGLWSVPSGKVKYEEIPIEALYREAKEETNLDVEHSEYAWVDLHELQTGTYDSLHAKLKELLTAVLSETSRV